MGAQSQCLGDGTLRRPRLAVESAIGQGTRITVDVPIDERA